MVTVLWHFKCNDNTHYVEYVEKGSRHLRRLTEEAYEALLIEKEEGLDFLQ